MAKTVASWLSATFLQQINIFRFTQILNLP